MSHPVTRDQAIITHSMQLNLPITENVITEPVSFLFYPVLSAGLTRFLTITDFPF